MDIRVHTDNNYRTYLWALTDNNYRVHIRVLTDNNYGTNTWVLNDNTEHTPVADPGFSPGGAPTLKIGISFQIFAKNCMKMKEFRPPVCPLGSANVNMYPYCNYRVQPRVLTEDNFSSHFLFTIKHFKGNFYS